MKDHIIGYAGYVPGRRVQSVVKEHINRENQADIPGIKYTKTKI